MLRTGIFRAPPVTDGAFLFSATSDRLGPCDGRMQGHVGERLARFSCLSCERVACRRRFSSVSMGFPEVASRLEAVSGTLVCSEERPRKVDGSTCSCLGIFTPTNRRYSRCIQNIQSDPNRLARRSFAQPRERLAPIVKVVGSFPIVADQPNEHRSCRLVDPSRLGPRSPLPNREDEQ